MSEEKKKIEAVLFSTGRLMAIEEISKILELNPDVVKTGLEELEKDYKEKDSAMTIQSHEDKYKLNIRKEYGYITNKLVSSTEMDSPTTKTLAVIAFKNPALQSDVIKIRGNKAYDHISILKDQGLITSEKHGRTKLLKLTDKFFDYFDTAEPAVKEKFEAIKEKYKETLEELEKEPTKETSKDASVAQEPAVEPEIKEEVVEQLLEEAQKKGNEDHSMVL